MRKITNGRFWTFMLAFSPLVIKIKWNKNKEHFIMISCPFFVLFCFFNAYTNSFSKLKDVRFFRQ